MVIQVLDDKSPASTENIAFLKLFDRRFADQLRKDNGIEPWTKEMERSYADSVESGSIHPFLEKLHHVKDFKEDTEEDWDDAQNEAFLADELSELYKTEISVYERLQAHQGPQIPQLLAVVDIDITPALPNMKSQVQDGLEPFRVKGILLEFIQGPNLWDIVDSFPQTIWQNIVDQAIHIVHLLDYDILNKDIQPENFLVCDQASSKEDQSQHIRVCMIDFALC